MKKIIVIAVLCFSLMLYGCSGDSPATANPVTGNIIATVSVSWDASASEPNIDGYKVYFDTLDGGMAYSVDAGMNHSVSVDLDAKGVWYFSQVSYVEDPEFGYLESLPDTAQYHVYTVEDKIPLPGTNTRVVRVK